jgi:hypothetical protein
MINNIHNNQVTSTVGSSGLPHAEAVNRRPSEQSDAAAQVDFADLINQAMQATQAEADAVQKARELLQSGRLTSPENIRSAAENIITFGI